VTQLIMKKLSGVRPEVLYLGGYGRGARNFISPSLLLVHFHSYQILNASIWLSIFVGGGATQNFLIGFVQIVQVTLKASGVVQSSTPQTSVASSLEAVKLT